MTENFYLFITTIIDVLMLIINIGLVIIGAVGMFAAWRQLKYLGEQMHEARLSSSMTGCLTLYGQYDELGSLREAIAKVFSKEWSKQSYQNQVEVIRSQRVNVDGEDRPLKYACIDIANFYEVVGALVSTRALPYQVAYTFFGGSTIDWWGHLHAWVKDFRERADDPLAFSNFEKIANSFDKERLANTQAHINSTEAG